MNDQQKRAINTPCYLACETTNPRLARSGREHTEILSVNAGYE